MGTRSEDRTLGGASKPPKMAENEPPDPDPGPGAGVTAPDQEAKRLWDLLVAPPLEGDTLGFGDISVTRACRVRGGGLGAAMGLPHA